MAEPTNLLARYVYEYTTTYVVLSRTYTYTYTYDYPTYTYDWDYPTYTYDDPWYYYPSNYYPHYDDSAYIAIGESPFRHQPTRRITALPRPVTLLIPLLFRAL